MRHLAIHPLNEDRRLHVLVAQIYVLLLYWSGAAGKRNPTVFSVAPWLDFPDGRKKRAADQREATTAALYCLAYRALGTPED